MSDSVPALRSTLKPRIERGLQWKSGQGLQIRGCDAITSFMNVVSVDEALEAQEFTVQEEFEILISWIRSEDTRCALTAMRLLHTRLKDLVASNSNTIQVQETLKIIEDSDDPQHVRREASTTKLVNSLKLQEASDAHPQYEIRPPHNPQEDESEGDDA